jgi:hypothetical protein
MRSLRWLSGFLWPRSHYPIRDLFPDHCLGFHTGSIVTGKSRRGRYKLNSTTYYCGITFVPAFIYDTGRKEPSSVYINREP